MINVPGSSALLLGERLRAGTFLVVLSLGPAWCIEDSPRPAGGSSQGWCAAQRLRVTRAKQEGLWVLRLEEGARGQVIGPADLESKSWG